jgi:hypothetical protein
MTINYCFNSALLKNMHLSQKCSKVDNGQSLPGPTMKTHHLKTIHISWASVAHAWNPSYSGARDQENHSSKPAWANSS